MKSADEQAVRRDWPRRIIIIALSLGCVAFALRGYINYAWLRLTLPKQPQVNLAGMDPAIVKAVEQAQRAVRAAPISSVSWGRLGMVLMVHQFREASIVCYAEAERLDPREPRWPYLHGTALAEQDVAAAIPNYERAIGMLGPDEMAPRLRLAELLVEYGRPDDAEKIFRDALARNPNEPHALLGLGRLAIVRGQYADAVGWLNRAASSKETAKSALVLLSSAQARLGHAAESADAARRGAAQANDPKLQVSFEEEADVFATGRDVWLNRASQFLKLGEVNGALQLFRRITRDYPDSGPAWMLYGWAWIHARNFTAAESALRTAVKLTPNCSECFFHLGSALFEQGKFSEAATNLTEAIRLRPDSAVAHYNLGLCLLREDKPAEAIASLCKAIYYRADLEGAYTQLAKALALAGQREEALTQVRRALELNPSDRVAADLLEKLKHDAVAP